MKKLSLLTSRRHLFAFLLMCLLGIGQVWGTTKTVTFTATEMTSQEGTTKDGVTAFSKSGTGAFSAGNQTIWNNGSDQKANALSIGSSANGAYDDKFVGISSTATIKSISIVAAINKTDANAYKVAVASWSGAVSATPNSAVELTLPNKNASVNPATAPAVPSLCASAQNVRIYRAAKLKDGTFDSNGTQLGSGQTTYIVSISVEIEDAAPTTKTVYLDLSSFQNWEAVPAGLCVWDGSNNCALNKVADCSNNHLYSAEVSASATTLYFKRCSDNTYSTVWDEVSATSFDTNNKMTVSDWKAGSAGTYVPSYAVTFNLNGKGENFTDCSNNESKIVRPTNPVANGFVFGGWYEEAECTNAWDFNTTISEAKTLYAKWAEDYSTAWKLNIWVGPGNDDWGQYDFVKENNTEAIGYYSIELSGEHDFELIKDGTTYYKNSGTMTKDNCSDWTFTTSASRGKINCSISGEYKFKVDFSGANPIVSVTYPAAKHNINYAETKDADMSAYPTQYTEGVGVASFAALADVAGFHFTGWSPASISAEATTDQTITAQWEALPTDIFKMSVKKGYTSNLATGATHDITASEANFTGTIGGTALVYNGKSSGAALMGNTSINLGGSSASYLKITLANGETLRKGDKIIISTANTFKLSETNSNSTTVSTASDGTYTITASDILVGSNTLYVWKSGGSSFTTITITRPADSEPNQFWNVTFDMQGATSAAIEAQSVKDGKKAVKPADPEKDGSDFAGWVVATTEAAYDWDVAVTADVALKATWTAAATKYTVTYKDGETTLDTEEVAEGQKAANVPTPKKELNTFAGWEDAEHNPIDFETATISADLTVYAKWTPYDEASSINIEQFVIDNGKSGDIQSALTAANFDFNLQSDDVLDDVAAGKDYENVAYRGLKLKHNGSYVVAKIPANTRVNVIIGNLVSAKVQIDGVDAAALVGGSGDVDKTVKENYHNGNNYYDLPAGGVLKVMCTQDSKTTVLKGIILSEIPTGTVNFAATDGENYYATFSNESAVEFGDDVTVYTVSVTGSTMALSEVSSKQVPARAGVLLKTESTTATYVKLANAPALEGNNALYPASMDKAELVNHKFYMLAYGDEACTPSTLGFYWGYADGAAFVSREGSAYLAIPAGQSAPVRFVFHNTDQATGVENVESNDTVKFIENGVLYIRKGDHLYNALGQMVK